MHLYKDLGDIPIKRFDIVYRTNDYKWLVVGYNGYDDIKVPKGANERWQELRKAWIELIDDSTVAYYFTLINETVYLQIRYNTVRQILQMLFQRKDEISDESLQIYVNALAEWNYKWQKKVDYLTNIERLLQQLKQSQNKINLKLSEVEELKKENELEGDSSTLEKQCVIIEQITGKNNIDTETTSALKWHELCKLAKEISKEREKHGRK